MNSLDKPKLLILDLLSGEARIVDVVPFIIGGALDSDWIIHPRGSSQANEVHFSDSNTTSGYLVSPSYKSNTPVLMDGEYLENSIALESERGSILKIENNLFGLCATMTPREFLQKVDLGSWTAYNGTTNQSLGSSGFHEIPSLVSSSGCPFDQCAVSLPTLGAPGTWLKDLSGIIPTHESNSQELNSPGFVAPATLEEEGEEEIPHDVGEYKCPVCWLHFDGKYIKNIASSEELLGDRIQGNDEYVRFIPKNWDGSGNALDEYGRPSPDTACPHCHSRLPAGFIESDQHIFSVVGAPSSGKSYYLAILIKKLKQRLSRKFEITLMDQDPTYNAKLNETTHTLFSARTAVEGRITKTDRRGANYKSVYRFGQWVDLPAPFMYSVSRTKVENTDSCLVFYDNAGEHFLPTFSQADDFQILHVAKASAIFFLYDPLANIEIKQALWKKEAPDQVKRDAAADQQGTILAQMNVKISRALGKPLGEKLKVPMAVMVGKCDLWHLLVKNWAGLRDPVTKDGFLSLDVIESNSLIIREFLNQYAAEIVSSIERISSNVFYFPVSSFGHNPKTHKFIVKDADGKDMEQEDVAPDPLKIKPFMIEAPTEWAISHIIPELIPQTSS